MPSAVAAQPANAGDQAEREALFAQWQPLAIHVAGKLWNTKPWIKRIGNLVDVEQEARVGLLKAIDHFDPDKPGAASFMTYAHNCIHRWIERRAQCSGVVRYPIQKQLEGLVPPAVRHLPAGDDEHFETAVVSDGQAGVDAEDERELVRRLVKRLPKDLRRALVLRFGLDGRGPRTFRNVAEEMETSQYYVRRWLRQAMERLTRRFERAERTQRLRWLLESLGGS